MLSALDGEIKLSEGTIKGIREKWQVGTIGGLTLKSVLTADVLNAPTEGNTIRLEPTQNGIKKWAQRDAETWDNRILLLTAKETHLTSSPDSQPPVKVAVQPSGRSMLACLTTSVCRLITALCYSTALVLTVVTALALAALALTPLAFRRCDVEVCACRRLPRLPCWVRRWILSI